MAELTTATTDDIGQLLRMMEAFYAIDHYPFDRSLNEQNLRTFLNNPDLGRLWLIGFKGETVGYVVLAFGFSFEYKGRDAFVDELFIKASHRNQGLGGEVLILVEEEAKKAGVRTMHLEVEIHNIIGNRLYARNGFKGKGRALMSKDISKS